MGLFLPRCRTLHLPLLNLIRFLSAQLSSLSRSRWMAEQPASISTTPPSFVSFCLSVSCKIVGFVVFCLACKIWFQIKTYFSVTVLHCVTVVKSWLLKPCCIQQNCSRWISEIVSTFEGIIFLISVWFFARDILCFDNFFPWWLGLG